MASSNIKDLLTSFSPTSEFYAISSGDGRVKIWNTLTGRLQMEFVNLSTDNAGGGIMESKHESKYLSLDYTCMHWAHLGKKNKRKSGHLLLVLGTGGGDVLSLDVSSGQLKWKFSDCHPGGVTAISFSEHDAHVYTTGIDGMVCQINLKTGVSLRNFQASTKAISSLAVSPDGNMFVIASAQLKVFNSNNKKIQKFTGHKVGVRCLTFSEDGKFILSSGVGERFVLFWKIDRSANHSTCCPLPMENPAVSLNCKGSESMDSKDTGLYVLAISEIGLCYFWHGKSIEDMRNCKAAKISVSFMHATLRNKGYMPTIYSGKIQSIGNQASGVVLVACGSIVKPSFEKLTVQYGIDVNISSSQESTFLPEIHLDGSNKDQASKTRVTVLDHANAEDAIIPLPTMIHNKKGTKKRKHSKSHIVADFDHELTDVKESNQTQSVGKVHGIFEEQYVSINLEEKLKSAGILAREDLISSEYCVQVLSTANFDPTIFKNASSFVSTNAPQINKNRETLLSLFHGDAFRLFAGLVIMWKMRSVSEEKVVPWICHILTHHNYSIMSQKASKQILEGLHKMTRFKSLSVGSLCRLSGSLQLITAQIAKAGGDKDADNILPSEPLNESDNDEDVDAVLYNEEEELSESSGDDE